MVYRAPPDSPPPDPPDPLRGARLDADLSAARRRSRHLLQAAGAVSPFLYLKIAAFGWIPTGVVRLGTSVWAALMVVWAVSLAAGWRIAWERKRT